jgi:hypothetical protein
MLHDNEKSRKSCSQCFPYIVDVKMDLRATEYKYMNWTERVQDRVEWREFCSSGLKMGHFFTR